MRVTVQLDTPLARTFRVEQVAGLFDVPLPERITHTLTAEVPSLAEPWTIGAIVGPSGSGKTTLARAAYGAIYEPPPWPEELPIIEALDRGVGVSPAGAWAQPAHTGRLPHEPGWPEARPTTIKPLARLLTAVGLGSVRTWLKPYRVLSTGERFRADLARAVLANAECRAHAPAGRRNAEFDTRPQTAAIPHSEFRTPHSQPLVFDEFTSTLDRTVARTACAALARLLRHNDAGSVVNGLRFVALTCHDDILPWLAPDWVLDLGASPPRLTRQQPRPLELPLRTCRVPQSAWREFAAQHYLTGGLAASTTCYAAWWDDCSRHAPCAVSPSSDLARERRHTECACYIPLAFCAVVAALGWRRTKRITRLVVRPEFQGLGIGSRLAEAVAALEAAKGSRVTITASHPAIVGHCARSPRWRHLGLKKTGSTPQRFAGRAIRCSTGRSVASFEFLA